MIQDFGYIEKAIANIKEVAEKQEENIKAAATLMADAIQNDRPTSSSTSMPAADTPRSRWARCSSVRAGSRTSIR